jgi:hypothetical protein
MVKKQKASKEILFKLKNIPYFFIGIGMIIIVIKIFVFFSYNTTFGTITEILERRDGMNYYSVYEGGQALCNIKVKYTNTDGEVRIGETIYEIEPCKKNLLNNFKVGDDVNVMYFENSPTSVRLYSEYFRELVVVIIILIVFPIIWILIPKEKLIKELKQSTV